MLLVIPDGDSREAMRSRTWHVGRAARLSQRQGLIGASEGTNLSVRELREAAGEGMSDDPEARAEWKVHFAAFLLPHLKGDKAERDSVLNAVLMALETAHADRIRHAARFCRAIGTGAQQHGEAATALADVLETMRRA